MGLKAINDSKVENIINALDNIEKISTQAGYENSDNNHELQHLRTQLQDKHLGYKELLADIEAQIKDFDDLYKVIRIKFLPDMLKQLKQILSEDSEDFILLKEIIQKTYRQ